MRLKEYVFTLNSYHCDKNCPYCIAKMNMNDIKDVNEEILNLKENIKYYQSNNISFKYFILSGNGETSLYDYKILKEIKDIVEKSLLFDDYRIQTSGNLFTAIDKLELFDNWIKEITVISNDSNKDMEFYNYKENYLLSKNYIESKRIRVNIVLLKSNIDDIINTINFYINQHNVETIALKLLDNSNNNTIYSKWIKDNAISYQEIDIITSILSKNYIFIKYQDNRFIYESDNKKIITINYNTKNNYDYISHKSKKEFSWHKSKIKKGTYGEFSKIEEEIAEAKDALEQNNHLMFLIELSDIIGSIEGLVNTYNLDMYDIINFSNKVKESKMINNG